MLLTVRQTPNVVRTSEQVGTENSTMFLFVYSCYCGAQTSFQHQEFRKLLKGF